jgi:GT2 family glycosyltransferase
MTILPRAKAEPVRRDAPLVSVLIVNYRGQRHLPACLQALAQQSLARHCFEVIVVDNHSQDNTVAWVQQHYPWVRVVASERNRGFAGGNNLAACHAHGAWLVLLNNDTIPDPHWLEELLRAAHDHPGARIASKLVFADEPETLNSAGLTLLRDGRGADRGFRHRDHGQYETTEEVFGGCGAALLIPAPADGSTLFDERLFLYCEDLELAWQHRLQGERFIYAPRSVVRHAVGAAAGHQSPLFWYYLERNRAWVALRNGDLFLAAYTGLLLALKFLQAWLRVGLRAGGARGRPGVAWAVTRAGIDYGVRVPSGIVERIERRRLVRGWPCAS